DGLQVGLLCEPLHLRIGFRRIDAEPATDLIEQSKDRRELLLGEDVDLQIQMRAAIREVLQVTLRDQNDARQDDRFEGQNQVQQIERMPIEREARRVQDDPDA